MFLMKKIIEQSVLTTLSPKRRKKVIARLEGLCPLFLVAFLMVVVVDVFLLARSLYRGHPDPNTGTWTGIAALLFGAVGIIYLRLIQLKVEEERSPRAELPERED
jgi:hypothetical protein